MPAGKLHHLAVKMGAGYNLVTLEEFCALPLNRRVDLVLEDRIQFLDDLGQNLDPRDGLKQLKAMMPGQGSRQGRA